MNWANALTSARLVMGPVILWMIVTGQACAAFLVFVVAMLTDLCDGYLARRSKQVTRVGELLDPLADKVLVTLSLFALAATAGELVPTWMLVVVVARELLILGCRLGVIGTGSGFSTSRMAKWKTAAQMGWISLILMFLAATQPETGAPLLVASGWMTTTLRVCGIGAILLTVASGVAYVVPARLWNAGAAGQRNRGGPLL
ncbi:CDP-alcohol phosphatidyltransferase family protein [bacterium]|nr:CDP-alcohol phosphatidyltransferase family protein [bacterium]